MQSAGAKSAEPVPVRLSSALMCGTATPLETAVRLRGPPTDLSATPGTTKLGLSWTAAPGSVVTGYEVHYTSAPKTGRGRRRRGGRHQRGCGLGGGLPFQHHTTPSETISSLSIGTAYRMRVRVVRVDLYNILLGHHRGHTKRVRAHRPAERAGDRQRQRLASSHPPHRRQLERPSSRRFPLRGTPPWQKSTFPTSTSIS